MAPYLITSARPADSSRSGSVPRQSRVDQHGARLVERADHVLAERMVDAGLAADGRVDLREQRRRHLHEGHAALVDRGRESGEVADDAAAERDQHRRALRAHLEEAGQDVLQRRPVLVRLAVRYQQRFVADAARPRGSRERAPANAHATVALLTTTARRATAPRRLRRPAPSAPAPMWIGYGASGQRDVQRVDHGVPRRRGPARTRARSAAPRRDRTRPRDRDLAIERVALGIELGQPGPRIGRLQQRPVPAVPHALPERRGIGVQVDDRAVFLQARAVAGPQHGAAAGGQHDAREHA